MVFLNGIDAERMIDHMAKVGVRVSGPRWVVHLDVDDDAIERAVEAARGLA